MRKTAMIFGLMALIMLTGAIINVDTATAQERKVRVTVKVTVLVEG